MIDSTNPRQLADNIRKLWDKFKSISGDLLPSRSTATTGQILKLTGETKTPSWADEYRYTPPAYSNTAEVNTGQKWIDGKDIYCKVFTGTFGDSSAAITVGSLESYDSIISLYSIQEGVTATTMIATTANSISTAGTISVSPYGAGAYERQVVVVVYYTKPDPTPGRAPEDSDQDQEPEPEEKKTTKKKTK